MTSALDRLPPQARTRLRPRAQPAWTAPMLAVLTNQRFSDPGWIFERKLDGERCLAFRRAGRLRLLSRTRQPLHDTYPELVGPLQSQPSDFIVDGEIVAFQGRRTSFERLQQRLQLRDPISALQSGVAVFYYLFDLLYLDGNDTTALALRDRKALLRGGLSYGGPLRYLPHRNTHGQALYHDACRRGWEGLIAKRADAPYQHRRSQDWRKLKCVNEQEFVIGGWTEPTGTRVGLGALLVGYHDHGTLRYAGKVGTGYRRAVLVDLRARLERLARPEPPFQPDGCPAAASTGSAPSWSPRSASPSSPATAGCANPASSAFARTSAPTRSSWSAKPHARDRPWPPPPRRAPPRLPRRRPAGRGHRLPADTILSRPLTTTCRVTQWLRTVRVSARGVRHGGRLSDRPRPDGLRPKARGSKEWILATARKSRPRRAFPGHFTPRPVCTYRDGMVTETADEVSLTDVEQALVDHVTRGELLDLAAGEPVDEAAMRGWDSSRTVRAAVLRDILRGRLAPEPDPHGLRLRGAHISGRLDLENLTTGVAVELVDCLLGEGLVARDATLPFLTLRGCRLEHPTEPPLAADQLTAAGLVLDRAVITADCENDAVRLPGARLGMLSCDGATMRNNSGPVLHADSLQVDHDVFFSGGFTAVGTSKDGAVRLLGAHLGGQLDCTNATMHNDTGPALTAQGLQVDHDVFLRGGFQAVGGGSGVALNLSQVRIGGVLEFAPARLEHTADPQARLALDGLTYAGLPAGISSREWLRLLREATRSYAAQPYQQFAGAHRAAGHDGEVRRILMAQRQAQLDRRALTGWAERAWARLTGLTLGYGYQPWRALLALIFVAATAVVLALTLGAHGGVARTDPHPAAAARCSVVERVGVGLDLGLPLVKTGARARCDTTASTTGQALTLAGWGLQLLAWAFATLFVAGFTGIVRKT